MRYLFYKNVTVDPTRNYSSFDGFRVGAIMKLAHSALYNGPFPVDPRMDMATEKVHRYVLENLFEMFNLNIPVSCEYNMSVGDVVIIIDSGVETAYSCDSIGWTKLDNFDPTIRNSDWMTYEEYLKGGGN